MLQYFTMGKRIKQRRKELGITQNQFAEMLQISNNHISTIENGRGHASIELFCKICTALDVTPDYLLVGQIHSNDIPKNITDMLQQCTSEELALVEHMVEYLVYQHSGR